MMDWHKLMMAFESGWHAARTKKDLKDSRVAFYLWKKEIEEEHARLQSDFLIWLQSKGINPVS